MYAATPLRVARVPTGADRDFGSAIAVQIARLGDNVVVQVPLVDDAVVAVRRLAGEGVRVAATLVFSAAQALLAAKAGATSAVVPLDQLGALGLDPVPTVREVRQLFDRGDVECDLVAAFPPTSAAFTAAGIAGADAAVVDVQTLRSLLGTSSRSASRGDSRPTNAQT